MPAKENRNIEIHMNRSESAFGEVNMHACGHREGVEHYFKVSDIILRRTNDDDSIISVLENMTR
jgi:hypothetical protein